MLWIDLMDPARVEQCERLIAKADALRDAGETIYPPKGQVTRALMLVPPAKTKVVIIGQDPYVGPGQAEGLCFSVANGNPAPPSLKNIFAEYQADLGLPAPETTSLLPWANKGVLLLNTTLTVSAGRPASHADWGWADVTREILKVATKLPQPIVFICWGAHAKRAIEGLDVSRANNKAAIFSSHPSPLSAHRGFLGSRPFSTANRLLREMGATPMDWTLR